MRVQRNVQIKTKNATFTAHADFLSPPSCRVRCLKIILASKLLLSVASLKRSNILRPRRDAMFSSIYLHDLESPRLWCFGPCGALLEKNIVIVIYPLPILFGLFY